MSQVKTTTVAKLMLGMLDVLEIEAIQWRREARKDHELEQSAYTRGKLAFADGYVAAVRNLKHRIPKAWRKAWVMDE